MVMSFQDGIKYITALDQVPTPGTIANVDASSRCVVYGTVAHCNFGCHFNLNASGLTFDAADAVNQTVFDRALSRIVVGLWSRRAVDRRQIVLLAVFEQRIADGIGIANKTNTTRIIVLVEVVVRCC